MTRLPPNEFESGECRVTPSDEAAAPNPSQGPGVAADLPDDLKQRMLAAIEDDYRFVLNVEQFEAALYAPPDIRGESFEEQIAKLDELIDEQPLPIFMQRTG